MGWSSTWRHVPAKCITKQMLPYTLLMCLIKLCLQINVAAVKTQQPQRKEGISWAGFYMSACDSIVMWWMQHFDKWSPLCDYTHHSVVINRTVAAEGCRQTRLFSFLGRRRVVIRRCKSRFTQFKFKFKVNYGGSRQQLVPLKTYFNTCQLCVKIIIECIRQYLHFLEFKWHNNIVIFYVLSALMFLHSYLIKNIKKQI